MEFSIIPVTKISPSEGHGELSRRLRDEYCRRLRDEYRRIFLEEFNRGLEARRLLVLEAYRKRLLEVLPWRLAEYDSAAQAPLEMHEQSFDLFFRDMTFDELTLPSITGLGNTMWKGLHIDLLMNIPAPIPLVNYCPPFSASHIRILFLCYAPLAISRHWLHQNPQYIPVYRQVLLFFDVFDEIESVNLIAIGHILDDDCHLSRWREGIIHHAHSRCETAWLGWEVGHYCANKGNRLYKQMRNESHFWHCFSVVSWIRKSQWRNRRRVGLIYQATIPLIS